MGPGRVHTQHTGKTSTPLPARAPPPLPTLPPRVYAIAAAWSGLRAILQRQAIMHAVSDLSGAFDTVDRPAGRHATDYWTGPPMDKTHGPNAIV